ncbi:MAG: LemA family protein [Burkholderiales bacterium]|nr:LemA family protein [Burkholderiales bacterium]
MSGSVVFWSAIALLVFWAVGAHNRLVRLRGLAMQAFARLHLEFAQQAELLERCLDAAAQSFSASRPAELQDGASARWAALAGATAQFRASLAVAKTRPLDGGAVAALAAALTVLTAAWTRLCDECHDLAGEPMPASVLERWALLAHQANTARADFNSTVDAYNAAAQEFPAVLVAWLFGFQRARPL